MLLRAATIAAEASASVALGEGGIGLRGRKGAADAAGTNTARHDERPEVPTMAEIGPPRVHPVPWWGLFAPAGLEPVVLWRIAEATARSRAMSRDAVA